MNVDRGEYEDQRIIICPLPACRHAWCKECLKPLASSQTEHNCKQHGFERLMRKKGWKYCPGMFCLIPFTSFSCRQLTTLAFRLQDTGSERDGMQPHDGKFCSFFLELILNINYPIFSAGLLDVMCKSLFNS